MPLFKYLPPARADFFKTLRLRYSQPAEFNDPFEGRPFYLGLVPEDWMIQSYPRRFAKVLKEQYESMDYQFQKAVKFGDFQILLEGMRPEIYNIFQEVDRSFIGPTNAMMNETFTQQIGALSLSEVSDNLLMWGHYTESHKGFVIEFDPNHPVFATKMTDEDLWKLHKIVYASERPKTYVIDLDMKAILLTKHHSWSYEHEWKHFRPLPQATEVLPGNPLPICLFDFPPESIKSVIFGTRIQPETKSKIEDAIRARPNLQHVRLFQMQLDDRNYQLSLIPR